MSNRSSGGYGQGGGGGGPLPTKKFVLKPYKTSLVLDQHQAVELWLKLQQAIGRIHNQEASQLSFEELYRYVCLFHKNVLFDEIVFFCTCFQNTKKKSKTLKKKFFFKHLRTRRGPYVMLMNCLRLVDQQSMILCYY